MKTANKKYISRTDFDPQIGPELETYLIDADGELSNQSDAIIGNPNASKKLQEELSLAMVEFTAHQERHIGALAESVLNEVAPTLSVADELGLRILPSTTIGPGTLQRRNTSDIRVREKVLGEKVIALYDQIAGIHLNTDFYEDRVKQHTLATALDPTFALMSSTPFFEGNNSINDYRVRTYRHDMYTALPELGKLLGYVTRSEEVFERQARIYDAWAKLCEAKGEDHSYFHPFNTYRGSVLFKPNMVENRGADTNLISNLLGYAALTLGCHRQLPTMKFVSGTPAADNEFSLPTFKELEYYEAAAIQSGLKDPKLHAYLGHVLSFAERGLQDDEQQYLEPLKQYHATKQNFSDEITAYAKHEGLYHNGSLNPDGVRQVRGYIADRFRSDFETVSRLLN